MKILLSWLVDYLDCSLADINVDSLVHLFNTRTAEIETFERVTCDPVSMFVARVVSFDKNKTVLFCAELDSAIELPCRADVVIGKQYMVFREESRSWRWLSISEFCIEKEGFFPANTRGSAYGAGS